MAVEYERARDGSLELGDGLAKTRMDIEPPVTVTVAR